MVAQVVPLQPFKVSPAGVQKQHKRWELSVGATETTSFVTSKHPLSATALKQPVACGIDSGKHCS